ncbi:MAG: hypothetical protein JHC61_07590 [Burkholderiaceae bacterium]|nr:hypothetical protein [Burkholderiaceae bacterium]
MFSTKLLDARHLYSVLEDFFISLEARTSSSETGEKKVTSESHQKSAPFGVRQNPFRKAKNNVGCLWSRALLRNTHTSLSFCFHSERLA